MLGISYGELFLIVGFTAAVIGPKDLPLIARTAGRFAGKAIGYVQMARGQFENIVQNPEVGKMYKELQDAHAQLAAIRHELQGLSSLNSGALLRSEDHAYKPTEIRSEIHEKPFQEGKQLGTTQKDLKAKNECSSFLHSQAVAYSWLAELPTKKINSPCECNGQVQEHNARDGQVTVLAETSSISISSVSDSGDEETINHGDNHMTILPISAEIAGLIPKSNVMNPEEATGSDVLLRALFESEVANKAKDYFSQSQNQLRNE